MRGRSPRRVPLAAAMAAQVVLLLLPVLLLVGAAAAGQAEPELQRQTFRTAPFKVGPGMCHKKFYGPVAMPQGHIAVRSFRGEIMGEDGPVPLSQVYVHHWVAMRIYGNKTVGNGIAKQGQWLESTPESESVNGCMGGHPELVEHVELHQRHSGSNAASSCELASGKFFGGGAETRGTTPHWPAPYGLVFGDEGAAPEGKEEQVIMQVHVIDTRGAVSAKDCLECNCNAFNVSVDETGKKLPEGYTGGLLCCYHGGHCATKPGFNAEEKTLWLEYTFEWVPMDPCVVPLKYFVPDVTPCKIEFDVPSCEVEGQLAGCVDRRIREFTFPESGTIVYGVGHQHYGGQGIMLSSAKDGTTICDSTPNYGRGSAPGSEAGYVTGMNGCELAEEGEGYHVEANQTLSLTSTYSKLGGGHTGAMGLFAMFLAADKDVEAVIGQCEAWRESQLEDSHAELEAEMEDDEWKVSVGGAVLGFGLGVGVAGMLATVILTMQRQQVASAAPYSPLASA